MLRQKESVTVGISGGADSVCLFLQLYKLKEKLGIELKAVTVEHGIRGDESEKDAEFSKKFCEERGIPCRIVHVDAPKRAAEKGISLEEAARQLRYEAFFENTAPGDTIAFAHDLEDHAGRDRSKRQASDKAASFCDQAGDYRGAYPRGNLVVHRFDKC